MNKGLLYIMAANMVGLIISTLINFLLPKYLSVDTYAAIRTYALYITYAGFFSLGYNDGMYLKYGGRDIKEISKEDFSENIGNYITLELAMLIMILLVGYVLSSPLLIAFSFGMFSTNMLGYLRSLFQATGEFKAYGSALNIEKILVFTINIILLFVLKTDYYLYYVGIQVFVGFFTVSVLLMKLKGSIQDIHYIRKISPSELINNIKSGFILMLGNFSSIFFTGLDRWFIKILMPSFYFAMYSFAVSMQSVIDAFMTPITVSLYNYFCKNPSLEQIRRIKSYVLVWVFFVIGAAFPAKWIVNIFLEKYNDSIALIFYLFAAQVFFVIVKGIYVNIYKAQKRQSTYLKQMCIMILIGIVLNIIFYFVFRTMTSIALATLSTSIIWAILCESESKKLRYTRKEYIAMTILVIAYIIIGQHLNAIMGIVLYYFVFLVVMVVFMRETMRQIWSLGKTMIGKYVRLKK